MVENIFTELKAKMAEQKHEAGLTELEKRLVRCKTALESSNLVILQLLESEREHQIMEAGYSEGE